MQPTDHLAEFERALDALAAIDPSHLDRRVPSCPDWSVRELYVHLGFVYAYNRGGFDVEVGEPPAMPEIDVPEDDAVIDWAVQEGRTLLARLRAEGSEHLLSTFAGTKPASWMCRRQAHESAIHAWDAYHAIGETYPLLDEPSSDGVDEWLEMMAHRPDRASYDPPKTLHLHSTDGDGEWMISFGDEFTWSNEHGKGDIAVRGETGQLFLLVWGRATIDSFETFGDVPTLADMLLPI